MTDSKKISALLQVGAGEIKVFDHEAYLNEEGGLHYRGPGETEFRNGGVEFEKGLFVRHIRDLLNRHLGVSIQHIFFGPQEAIWMFRDQILTPKVAETASSYREGIFLPKVPVWAENPKVLDMVIYPTARIIGMVDSSGNARA